jgi:hypothetical protein
MSKDKFEYPQMVRINQNNLKDFPKIEALFSLDEVKFDSIENCDTYTERRLAI